MSEPVKLPIGEHTYSTDGAENSITVRIEAQATSSLNPSGELMDCPRL